MGTNLDSATNRTPVHTRALLLASAALSFHLKAIVALSAHSDTLAYESHRYGALVELDAADLILKRQGVYPDAYIRTVNPNQEFHSHLDKTVLCYLGEIARVLDSIPRNLAEYAFLSKEGFAGETLGSVLQVLEHEKEIEKFILTAAGQFQTDRDAFPVYFAARKIAYDQICSKQDMTRLEYLDLCMVDSVAIFDRSAIQRFFTELQSNGDHDGNRLFLCWDRHQLVLVDQGNHVLLPSTQDIPHAVYSDRPIVLRKWLPKDVNPVLAQREQRPETFGFSIKGNRIMAGFIEIQEKPDWQSSVLKAFNDAFNSKYRA